MGPQIPQRLTDQTAERLLHMIGSDPAYRPGAKLPNEPRLCELFGVSRTTLRDLFEIRMMIEPQAARLACLRGTDEELREIAHRAQCVARAIREGENFTQPEEAFHQAFVAATHNPFMEQLLPIIHNALHETWAALDVEALLAQPTLQDNELLMGFLQQRDEEGVRHTMAAHIRRTINLLDQAGFGSV